LSSVNQSRLLESELLVHYRWWRVPVKGLIFLHLRKKPNKKRRYFKTDIRLDYPTPVFNFLINSGSRL